MRHATLLILMMAFLAGCETVEPVVRIEFPEAEYAALAETGKASVRGQAFMKTLGGDVKTAAGNDVTLNPVTSYSQQWYMAYCQKKPLEPADPRINQYIHKTIADAEGRFEFLDVPAGEYFLVATVIWYAPTGYRGSLQQQGGLVVKRIMLEEGESEKVILTP